MQTQAPMHDTEARRVTLVANGAVGAALAAAFASDGRPLARIATDAHHCGDSELAIVALEGATIGQLLDVNRTLLAAGVNSLFVVCENDNLIVGPITVPGVSACFECRLRFVLERTAGSLAELVEDANAKTGGANTLAPGVLEAASRAIVEAVGGLAQPHAERHAFSAAVIHGRGRERGITILPSGQCASCATGLERDDAFRSAALAELAVALDREGFEAELAYSPAPAQHPDRYRSVGIVGGGTAGYLAALLLRTRMPELDVTLIESSRIPIIRVGEATTPEMVRFLHSPALLNIDIVDFHRRVRPTFKLGIGFEWGATPDARFNYPFQYAPLGDAMIHDGHLDAQSVASLLMCENKAPLIDDGRGGVHSLLESVRFAYHLDNERFVRFLQEEAARRGIRHIDTTIESAVTSADGESIDHLVSDSGERLHFDLYIDASGFRSILMEQALRSPFVSFAPSLCTDSALVAHNPHDGHIRPYTQAQTMAAGWCWSISFEEADHIGYVYSSSHLDEDAALAEMRRVHPRMGAHRQVKFRSGRHQHFMKGNVVAIGNSYGFVEPLESTALHMVIVELEHLTNHFPLKNDSATPARLNRKLNELWDELHGFLAVHYRFNHRLDTEFWREARACADVSGVEERIALFRERAPLTDRPSLSYSVVPPDFFASDHALDTMLLGQGVEGRLGPARQSREAWLRRAELRRQVVARALPQALALPILREREPELLRRFIENPASWVHQWITR